MGLTSFLKLRNLHETLLSYNAAIKKKSHVSEGAGCTDMAGLGHQQPITGPLTTKSVRGT